MKRKNLFLSICSFVFAFALFGGISTAKFVPETVKADAVSAQYFNTDTTSKGDWASAGYGKDGYLVFDGHRNGTGAGFYSNMYNIGDTDTTVGAQTLMTVTGAFGTGWLPTGSGGWDITIDGTTKTVATNTDTHVLKSDAIIASWGVNACTFQGYAARTVKPYIPETTTNTMVRLMGKTDHPSVFWADVNIGFTLNTEEKVYVTLQICDYASGGGNGVTATDSVVAVYNSAFTGGKLVANQAVARQTLEGCYGTDMIATTDVTTNGSYVTFLLDGSVAKEYMFVVYGNNPTAATYQPMIGGVFFDYTYGLPVSAYYDSTDTTTKGAWTVNGYGKDGYLVFDGTAENANIGFYSDMYNVGEEQVAQNTLMKISGANNTGWQPVGTGGWDITFNGTTKSAATNTQTFTLQSNAIISDWGANAVNFQGHGARTFKPYIPGTTTNTLVRMTGKVDAGYYSDVNVGFTLNTDKKVYVTLQIHDYAGAGGNTVTATNSVVAVYNKAYTGGALAFRYEKSVPEYFGEPVASTNVTTNGTYVTFLVDGSVSKNYTFVVYREDTTATAINPSIGGVFFDYEKGAPEVATHVATDAATKGAWETAGYGKDGYFVFDSMSNGGAPGVYSDIYMQDGAKVAGNTLIPIAGSYSAGWLVNSAYTLQENAVVKGWGVNSQNFQGYAARTARPYIPGTTTNTIIRMHGKMESGYYADTNVGFTLNTDDKVYVTLQVHDYSANNNANANGNLVVAVYNKAYTAGLASTSNATIENYFGTPLTSTKVSANGVYVTFLLDGAIAKDYTVVVHRENATDTSTPGIGGVFFDYERIGITSASLTLDGTIGLNFYVSTQGTTLATDAYMQFLYADQTTKVQAVSEKQTDGTYKFTASVAAKDYASLVKAQLFTADGESIGKEFSYSVADYINTVKTAGESVYGEKLIALVTALEDYGKASNNYFTDAENTLSDNVAAVNTNSLMQYAYSVNDGSLPAGVELTDFSLVLESETSLRVYFTATSMSGVVCKVNGEVAQALYTGTSQEYCIEITDIAATELNGEFVVAIGDYEITLSALSYAYRALQYSANTDLQNAMKALYLYNQAASEYFASVNA